MDRGADFQIALPQISLEQQIDTMPRLVAQLGGLGFRNDKDFFDKFM